ncbi:isochorismate synthase MenF [Cellulomonas sp. Leaf334]|uniref:isochorismate synthase n=1 Tax=Cellulomonas sp. Leaf334 TaxID=1736339 RepID=UPI0009E8830A|nr:isochorismate synthase [Cellulomonas sp. Leaf334]
MSNPGFALLGPHHRVQASGHLATLPTELAAGPTAAAHALRLVRETGGPVVVGAVPFDANLPGRFSVPAHVAWDAPHPGGAPHDEEAAWRPGDDPQYRSAVRAALRGIESGLLRKLVLARAVDLVADDDIDVVAVRDELDRRTTLGYTFDVDLGPGTGRLVGSSPELLISVTDGLLRSQPLAGSTARHADDVADRAARDALLTSAKDLGEHRLVVDAMREALAPYVSQLDVPEHPGIVATPHLWHLGTTITGRVRTGVTSLELAYALHPTPAVCGVPTSTAADLVRILEPVDRGFYAGLVGWMDARGDGEWVIALRCGVVRGRTLRAHAGAGVVAASTAESELRETEVKLRTFLAALSAVPGLRDARLAGVGA